ncbi:MAG: hypothetical protein JSR90_23145 [Proteobacteria bacterium]|nr:hypothetical protein [Pseudomonadota bacterium]
MINSLIQILLGLVSAFLWAREISKGYWPSMSLGPSTLARLRGEGSALFGVCVGICSFCLLTSIVVVVSAALGSPAIF